MSELGEVAPAFIEMAHRIVWCSVATVDRANRPRVRVLHPIWTWRDGSITGWIATSPTPVKRAHLDHSPFVACNYWSPSHDTCLAECDAEWMFDDDTRTMAWELFVNGPEPVGYDPSIVPGWDAPTSEAFAVLRLTPWRLRVFPGTVLLGLGGDVLSWSRA
jgi:hypothetical protein